MGSGGPPVGGIDPVEEDRAVPGFGGPPGTLASVSTGTTGSSSQGTEMADRSNGTFEPTVGHLPWEIKRAEREAARTIDNLLRSTGLTKSQFGVAE